MSVATLYGFVYLSSFVSALPANSSTISINKDQKTTHQPAWVDGPSGRGTYSLILSCFTTLFLCAWSAVHLNIPGGHSDIKVLASRLQWMVTAILTLEWVLYCAFNQWCSARDLVKEINKIGADSITGLETNPQYSRRCSCLSIAPPVTTAAQGAATSQASVVSALDSIGNGIGALYLKKEAFIPWTMTQGYFAISGGIAADVSGFHSAKTLTFTPAGIVELARAGVLPQVETSTIQDKCKADSLAKAIVCIQVGWFFANSIARPLQHLPLTLLEIHTLTHAICALMMYAVWLKKPYGILRPHITRNRHVVELAALFSLTCETPSTSEMACAQRNTINIAAVRNADKLLNYYSLKSFEYLEAANSAVDYLRRRGSHFAWRAGEDNNIQHYKDYVVTSTKNHEIVGELRQAYSDLDNSIYRRNNSLMIFVSMIYGGTHLSAWAFKFPTALEMWFWRASGIAVVVIPFLFAMDDYVEHLAWKSREKVKAMERASPQKMKRKKRTRICGGIARSSQFCYEFLVVFSLGSIWPVSRLYLLAESFASLRSPAPGTYKDVEWAKFIPHAS